MRIRLATRKSKLALWQAHHVKAALEARDPALDIELVLIESEGDQIQNRPLAEIGGKGLFIKRLEEALIAGKADIAVHSLKDVPPQLAEPFVLAAFLKRDNPFDAFVSTRYASLAQLPKSASIGTSSVRRKAEILARYPELIIKNLRGNVDTRLKKLIDGDFDAIILSYAGLSRLGLQHYAKEILPPEICLPSVGQGTITVECLKENTALRERLAAINHPATEAVSVAERAMNFYLGASCTSPVGSFAVIAQDQLILKGALWSEDGARSIATLQRGRVDEAESIGKQAAEDLFAKGARDLIPC